MQRQNHPTTVRHLRLDIQGLRALAVALVVIFHLFPSRLPGGYIGVDIFFVISGFLITGHLLREVDASGRIRVTEFWARRIRRLLPASLLVLLATIVMTMTVMPVNTRIQNYEDIGYAAGYILNWRLATNSVDYLNASFPPTLVQHYWSLSIEEQFYLVWPVLIAIVVGLAALTLKPARKFILGALIVVFILSLGISVFETLRSQPFAYFVTTSRAWEFALGGLIVMIPPARTSAALRGILSIFALIAIASSAFLFGSTTPFPGAIALIPVTATAILLWCGDSSSDEWVFAPQRLTHNRVVQFLGDTSYSIYLWHWPLILVMTAAFPSASWGWRRAVIVVPITLILSWLTLKFVEDPVRKAPGVLKRRSVTFLAMFLAVATIIGLVFSQINTIHRDVDQRQAAIESLLNGEGDNGPGGSLGEEQLCVGAYAILNKCASPHDYEESLIDATFAQQDRRERWFEKGTGKEHCTEQMVGTFAERSCSFPGDTKRVMVLGDSHADELVIPLERIAKEKNWDLRLESRTACELFVLPQANDGENETRCTEWSKEHLSSIEADPNIDVVILALRADRVEASITDAEPGLKKLQDSGKQVIVLHNRPSVRVEAPDGKVYFEGPECLVAQGAVDDACSWVDKQGDDWFTTAAKELGLPMLNLYDVVCPEETCHMITGDLVVYSDSNHLTGMFLRSLEGWLSKELDSLIH